MSFVYYSSGALPLAALPHRLLLGVSNKLPVACQLLYIAPYCLESVFSRAETD
jgi:hypothetical protein